MSILKQTWNDFRLAVIDDASPTDEWRQILAPFAADPRIHLYQTSARVGPYRIANRFIAGINTEFVAFQDADDISLPRRFEHELMLLHTAPADIVGCRFAYIDETGRRLTSFRWKHAFVRYAIRRNDLVHHAASIVRRSVYEKLKGYDGTTQIGADTDFMLRARYLYRMLNCRQVLYHRRLRASSLTSNQATGSGSPTRQLYKDELRRRSREWDRFAGSDRLICALKGRPNDVCFDITRLR